MIYKLSAERISHVEIVIDSDKIDAESLATLLDTKHPEHQEYLEELILGDVDDETYEEFNSVALIDADGDLIWKEY